jgi:hypothetical protein
MGRQPATAEGGLMIPRESTPMERARRTLNELTYLELLQMAQAVFTKSELIELLLTHGGAKVRWFIGQLENNDAEKDNAT